MNPYISLYATLAELKIITTFNVVSRCLLGLSRCILCMIYDWRIFYVFGLWILSSWKLSTSLSASLLICNFFNYRISHRATQQKIKCLNLQPQIISLYWRLKLSGDGQFSSFSWRINFCFIFMKFCDLEKIQNCQKTNLDSFTDEATEKSNLNSNHLIKSFHNMSSWVRWCAKILLFGLHYYGVNQKKARREAN